MDQFTRSKQVLNHRFGWDWPHIAGNQVEDAVPVSVFHNAIGHPSRQHAVATGDFRLPVVGALNRVLWYPKLFRRYGNATGHHYVAMVGAAMICPLCQHERGEPGHVVGHVMKRPVWPTEATRAYSFGTRGWRQMSPLGIIGLIWIGFGLFTIGVAVRMKLRPLLIWIIAGPLLGPFSLFWLGAGNAQKKRIPPYNDGSGRYGAGGFLGNAGFGGGG